jgi:hypothetical protein
MKVYAKIGSKSIGLNTDVSSLTYVHKNEKGFYEQILTFKGSIIPTALEEPELFKEAKIEDQQKRQIVLTYPESKTDLILITNWENNKFIREHREMTDNLQGFCTKEVVRNGSKYISVYSR